MIKKNLTEWKLELSSIAIKDLKKLDKATSKLILEYLHEKLETEKDPCRFGKPLLGDLKNLWRYRVKDYRIICKIHKNPMIIFVIHIGHRSEVYE